MACNCNQQTNYNLCNPKPCQEPQDCSCPTILETKCVTFEGDDLECSGIKKGTILTELIQQLDAFICKVKEDLLNAFSLKNIGDGAKVYKGDDLLGRKELRTVTKTGNLITVTENTNDIAVSIDESALNTFIEANQKTYSATNIGTGASIYKDTTVSGDNTQFNFKKIKSTGGTVTITEGVEEINIEVISTPFDVNITAGTNVTVTEPTANNFIVSASDTIVSLQNGVTTTVDGDGVITPYSVEVENLQKTISTFPYTLTSADDKYTIFINNGVSDVIINVPNGLVANFSCVFIQEGSGVVIIQQSGTATLLYPSTTLQNKIRGQYYWAMVEKKTTTDTYYLLGSLLPV